MFLRELRLINFKNYEDGILYPTEGINCIVGENGSGKTNLLDAIHYLSYTKSAFNSIDTQNIRHNSNFFSLISRVELNQKEVPISCSLKKGAKKVFKFDEQEYEKLSEHIGRFPTVLIAPNDNDLVRGGSEPRRKYFDSIISQLDQDYLRNLINYNHNLRQRNSLLKYFRDNLETDHDLIAPYNKILLEKGQAIYDRRVTFFERYLPLFTNNYKSIAEGKEEASIDFSSQFSNDEPGDILESLFSRDMESQRTFFGIHKDKWTFLINNDNMKQFGSQGQQKTFVIALKTAEFDLLKNEKGFYPILLLDDIFDKLDDARINNLMHLMTDNSFGQIFLTDARPERTKSILSQLKLTGNFIKVENGTFSKK